MSSTVTALILCYLLLCVLFTCVSVYTYCGAIWRRKGPHITEMEFTKSRRRQRDETGFHSDLTDIFDSEIIVKADFVHQSALHQWILLL